MIRYNIIYYNIHNIIFIRRLDFLQMTKTFIGWQDFLQMTRLSSDDKTFIQYYTDIQLFYRHPTIIHLSIYYTDTQLLYIYINRRIVGRRHSLLLWGRASGAPMTSMNNIFLSGGCEMPGTTATTTAKNNSAKTPRSSSLNQEKPLKTASKTS